MLSTVITGSVLSTLGDRRVHMPMWRANDRRDLTYLRPLLERGAVTPVIDSVVGLDGVPDAFRRLIAQQHVGKIVVRV